MRRNLFLFVLISALFVVVWAVTGGGFFWPGFAKLGWAVGLSVQAWGIHGENPRES